MKAVQPLVVMTATEIANDTDLLGKISAWGGAALAIFLILLTATDRLGKVLGRIGQIQEERISNARRVATSKDDGDIAELRRVANNLRAILNEERSMLEEERAVTNSYRNQAVLLYQYIIAVQRDPSKLSEPVPAPVDEDAIRRPFNEKRIREEKEEK